MQEHLFIYVQYSMPVCQYLEFIFIFFFLLLFYYSDRDVENIVLVLAPVAIN